MAGKPLLVLACLVLAVTAVTLNDSKKKKKIKIAPVDASALANEFSEALGEETPLLEEEGEMNTQPKALISSLKPKPKTTADKVAKAKAYAAMGGAAMPLAAPVPVPMAKAVAAEGEGTEVWASDFERDVTQLILGLSAGGLAATPFGDSVQKISWIIENDMMPKVLDAHNYTLTRLNELWNNILHAEAQREVRKTASDELQVLYTTASVQHKSCRAEEESLYNTNVKCHEDWRVSKHEMKLKCDLYEETAARVGETTNNQAIVAKAPSEDTHTYIERISETICGTRCAIVDYPPLCEPEGGEDVPETPGGDVPDPGGECPTEGIGFLHRLNCHKQACDDATALYNYLTDQCAKDDKAWSDKKGDCNNIQQTLDTSSCNWAAQVAADCRVYEDEYSTAKQEYWDYYNAQYDPDFINATTGLHQPIDMFEDRKAEWRGLKRMQCLIDSFGDGEVTHDEIDFCKAQFYETSHLNKTWHYDTAPEPMFDCTIPETYPNTAAYKAAEFTPLPVNARGRIDSYHCSALHPISTVPRDGSPSTCTCTRVILEGAYSVVASNGDATTGELVKCTQCLDVAKSTETNSCPVGTKLFSPTSQTDWETVLRSTEPDTVKHPHWIFDVTCPEAICTQAIQDSTAQEGLPLRETWQTSDGSPWWLKPEAVDRNMEIHYVANCFMGMTAHESATTLTFAEDNCNYHSSSYFCQTAMSSLEPNVDPERETPEGCICQKVEVIGTWSPGMLVKCEKCLDVFKSTQINSCPLGTKIFSPRTSTDWATFLASAEALRSPFWIIDVTRPQDGCGGCTDYSMSSAIPAQATWTTADHSPWWLRDAVYEQPNGDYEANCYMDLFGNPENEHSIDFDDHGCYVHSRSYYCQSLVTTTSTTTTTTTTTPTADPACAEFRDEFDSQSSCWVTLFDSSKTYWNGGSYYAKGDGVFIRSSTFQTVTRITGHINKQSYCSDQFVELTEAAKSTTTVPWQQEVGRVMFVWNCDSKYIYAQASNTQVGCSTRQWYEIEIEVTASTVFFKDYGGCTDLSVSDAIGATQLFINVGADCDYSCDESTGAQWDWIAINPATTTTTTPSLTTNLANCGSGSISGDTWTQTNGWTGARGESVMCDSSDATAAYTFKFEYESGTHHQVGVASSNCCEDSSNANTLNSNSGDSFAALYSYSNGWDRHRGAATPVGSPSTSEWWSGIWDGSPKTMDVRVDCASKSFIVGIEGGDDFLGEMTWPSDWNGVYPFVGGQSADHVAKLKDLMAEA